MKILKLELEVEQGGKRYRATGEIRKPKSGEFYLANDKLTDDYFPYTPCKHIIMEEIPGDITMKDIK